MLTHLLPQVEAADAPGELEDVAVELVCDVHDDDGGLGVAGARHHRLVVRQVPDTVDTVRVHALTLYLVYKILWIVYV